MVVLGRFLVFYPCGNIYLFYLYLFIYSAFWCNSWRLKMFWVIFYFEHTYTKEWGWSCLCNTGTKAQNNFLTLGIIQLWRRFFDSCTHHHWQKWTIDLLFKSKRARKYTKKFKTSSPPFCMDVKWLVPHRKQFFNKESDGEIRDFKN